MDHEAGDGATVGGCVKKLQIGALQPSSKDFILVALVIGKSEPRRVTMRDGGEKYVSNFTLRDSPSDIINLTLWTNRESSFEYDEKFHIGTVLEVSKPRVINRDIGSDKEKYSPAVTSPFHLSYMEGKTRLIRHIGDTSKYQHLLRLPSKASAGYFTISDVMDSKNLVEMNVDLCAAVKFVGPVKTFQGRDGEEKTVRDVKLFDTTSSCIILKLWDRNLIEMSNTWIPRETILFFADIKVGYDTWRECNAVSCTGRTIVTENPNTGEARMLAKYCQMADFSSSSRMDSLLASFNPASIVQVHNVNSLQGEIYTPCQEKDSMLITNVYGYITRMDIDNPKASTQLRCGNCSWMYRADDASSPPCCQNIDCRDYRSTSSERIENYDVRVDVTDETGTLVSVPMRSEVLSRALGIDAAEYSGMSDVTRTALKWDLCFIPLKISVGIMLPTQDRRAPVLSIVFLDSANITDVCSKVPAPAL